MVQPRCTCDDVGMNMATFGHWLKMQRAARRLSQSGLARALGMDRSQVAKMESGAIGLPKEETRARLHAYFGTSDDDLVAAGVLARLEFAGRPPFYVAAGDKPPPLPATVHDADAIVVSVHDPRADVLALLEGLTDAQVRGIVAALSPILAIAGIHERPAQSTEHHVHPETA